MNTCSLSLINPSGLYDPTPNGYCHVARVEPGTRLVYVSGQGGENAAGALSPNFRAQVSQAFRNLRTALAAAGADVPDVAKLTLLIVNHTEEKLGVVASELAAAWAGAAPPACTLIPVSRLALDGMLFEVEATAAVSITEERT